jgi:hypothetical protein
VLSFLFLFFYPTTRMRVKSVLKFLFSITRMRVKPTSTAAHKRHLPCCDSTSKFLLCRVNEPTESFFINYHNIFNYNQKINTIIRFKIYQKKSCKKIPKRIYAFQLQRKRDTLGYRDTKMFHYWTKYHKTQTTKIQKGIGISIIT